MPGHDDIVDPTPLTAQDAQGRLIPRQDLPQPIQREVEEKLEER